VNAPRARVPSSVPDSGLQTATVDRRIRHWCHTTAGKRDRKKYANGTVAGVSSLPRIHRMLSVVTLEIERGRWSCDVQPCWELSSSSLHRTSTACFEQRDLCLGRWTTCWRRQKLVRHFALLVGPNSVFAKSIQTHAYWLLRGHMHMPRHTWDAEYHNQRVRARSKPCMHCLKADSVTGSNGFILDR